MMLDCKMVTIDNEP